MRIARLDRRLTGAALATACCLLIPTQQKPLRWLAQQAHRIAPTAPLSPAQETAQDDKAAVTAGVPDQASGQTSVQEEAQHEAQAAALGYDLSGVAEALKFYREGHHELGDAALTTKDATVRAAVEWTFLRDHAVAAGIERITAFMRSHPDWPVASLRKHAEELAGAESARPERAAAFFAEFPPATSGGEIALAELLRSNPLRSGEAERLAR
jgi:soluble lytic murein transglycosylase